MVRRWWEQFSKLPWIDNIAMQLVAVVRDRTGSHVNMVTAEMIRTTVIRHCLLSYTLCIRGGLVVKALILLNRSWSFPLCLTQSYIKVLQCVPEKMRIEKVDNTMVEPLVGHTVN